MFEENDHNFRQGVNGFTLFDRYVAGSACEWLI